MHWAIRGRDRSYTHSHSGRQSGNHMSDIRADLIRNSSGNGPINLGWRRASDGKKVGQFAAKVYCNIKQTGIQGVNDSLNVSEITDVGIGQTDIAYISDMERASYGFAFGKGRTEGQNGGIIAMTSHQDPTASLIRIMTFQESNQTIDDTRANVTIHGDLA